MKQLTLSAKGFDRYGKTTRRAVFLSEMERVVPWADIVSLIEPFYPRAGTGRPPYGLERMLCIYFLQQWFNLSDPGVEEALYDSATMRDFAGIDLGRELAPDETTSCRFRHLLEAHDLGRRLFEEVHLHLEANGLKVSTGTILYQDQLARAAEKIDIACTRASEGRIVAVLDPYNPKGSTRHVNFITSKPCWATGVRPPKCQISHVVLDSSWEEQLALTLENHPRVLAYAKNQALGFEIPYLECGITRRYLPDFLVRLDDNGDAPLNLVLEVKGIKDESDMAKAETTRDLWVPGVDALGGFGRWAFAEFRDWAVMDEDFAKLVDQLLRKVAA